MTEAAKSRLAPLLRRALQGASARLRRIVPARRLVLRLACLVLGTALVLVSLVGFSTGEVLVSFIILPIGYGIAVSYWLLPWRSTSTISNGQLRTNSTTAARPRTPRPAAIRPQAGTRAKRAGAMAKPLREFAFTFDTPDQDRVRLADRTPIAIASGTVQLKCISCGKHYSVRGEGEIGPRQVPCPHCGSTLETIGAEQTIAVAESNGAPIVSVVCKACRAIIDVPRAAIGTPVPCPRCRAELPMTRDVRQPRQKRGRNSLVRT